MKVATIFAVLASLAAAAPTQPRDTAGGPFHIGLTKSEPHPSIDNFVSDRIRVGLKYSHALTEEGRDLLHRQIEARQAKAKRDGFPVPLTSLNGDVLYNAHVNFGTPKQDIGLLIDTGSPTLWTFAPNCTGTCGAQAFHDEQSSTFKSTGESLVLNYGSGHLEGGYATDVVDLGGLKDTLKFGLGWVGSKFEAMAGVSSGIIGLSWPDGSNDNYTPIWLSQIQGGKWADNQFGIYLNRAPPGATSSDGGRLTLAGTDTSLYTGDINYINLGDGGAQFGFAWIIPVDAISVSGQTIDLSSNQAIIDSGTTFIYGPQSQIEQYYSTIPGAQALTGDNEGLYTVPCDAKNLGVSLTFGGVSYPIQDVDLVKVASDDGQTCIGTVGYFPNFGLGNNWLVGDVFMKNVYTAFRYDPKSVGFAKLA